MNTTLLANHFAQVVPLVPPNIDTTPTLPETAGFVLLLTNLAGEVLIEYSQNAQARVWDLSQNGGVLIDAKRHVWNLRARLIADQLAVDFFHQRVEPGSSFYHITWADANARLDELLGDFPPAGQEGRLAA